MTKALTQPCDAYGPGDVLGEQFSFGGVRLHVDLVDFPGVGADTVEHVGWYSLGETMFHHVVEGGWCRITGTDREGRILFHLWPPQAGFLVPGQALSGPLDLEFDFRVVG